MLVDVPITDTGIDFDPESEAQEIIQNVITVCSTLKGTVPLDRAFGTDTGVIDLPVNIARAKISAQFIDAIRLFEPRAVVAAVSFKSDTDTVTPVVSLIFP